MKYSLVLKIASIFVENGFEPPMEIGFRSAKEGYAFASEIMKKAYLTQNEYIYHDNAFGSDALHCQIVVCGINFYWPRSDYEIDRLKKALAASKESTYRLSTQVSNPHTNQF